MYWVNSNNGDCIKLISEEKGVYALIARGFTKILIPAEFIYIKEKFGFLPVKKKKFERKYMNLYKPSDYVPNIYPTREEVRDFTLNNILK